MTKIVYVIVLLIALAVDGGVVGSLFEVYTVSEKDFGSYCEYIAFALLLVLLFGVEVYLAIDMFPF